MNRRLLLIALVAGLAVTSPVAWHIASTPAQPSTSPAGKSNRSTSSGLPISQVVLFSSGVGYFQREGEVEDTTRVDLSFPVSDINDLLKSLVLQDLGGGKISTIGYDSPDPLDKTLHSFALDLSGNPTFGEILNQARGQKIELAVQQSSGTQPALLTGVIVGMEVQVVANAEVHTLNLLCAEGMRSVPLSQVQRVRFLDPVVDADFRHALEVLAAAHNMEKKTVSLQFTGPGKRAVRVGYVVENPIWKTSYRLVLGKDKKIHLQGWANVENTTDEDWKDVRMALVSGRPISFQTDLYSPLYVPRPVVEMERFASLRPPNYEGPIYRNGPAMGGNLGAAGSASGGGLGALGGGGFGALGFGGGLGALGGGLGIPQGMNRINPYKRSGSNPQSDADDELEPRRRLTYEQLLQRQQEMKEAKDQAKKVGSALAELDATEGVATTAKSEKIGDHYQYTIEDKVNLNRQKSAMLPILDVDVEGNRISIFNSTVNAKFPLLGLRFKNTTGQPLTQGPITVYETGSYAGDSRIMDLQPGEERLLSFAIDLGSEVTKDHILKPEQLILAKLAKGYLVSSVKQRDVTTYVAKNRSPQDRTLLIEHPITADWKLTSPEKPYEITRDHYRLQALVAAGQTVKQEVVEERTKTDSTALAQVTDESARFYLAQAVVSAGVKSALEKALALRRRLEEVKHDLADEEAKLKALTEDQARLRANLKEMPATAAAYKRYLDKFDKQETEVETLQDRIKELGQEVKKRFKEYWDYAADLTVE